jgi:hypothetical protein
MRRLVGAKILSIKEKCSEDTILCIETDRGVMEFVHEQDCCEQVFLEDGLDDLKRMIGQIVLFAEEVFEEREPLDENDDSFTWTFYKISTINKDCTLRFYGCSNGYYSEDVYVNFVKSDRKTVYKAIDIHTDLDFGYFSDEDSFLEEASNVYHVNKDGGIFYLSFKDEKSKVRWSVELVDIVLDELDLPL